MSSMLCTSYFYDCHLRARVCTMWISLKGAIATLLPTIELKAFFCPFLCVLCCCVVIVCLRLQVVTSSGSRNLIADSTHHTRVSLHSNEQQRLFVNSWPSGVQLRWNFGWRRSRSLPYQRGNLQCFILKYGLKT